MAAARPLNAPVQQIRDARVTIRDPRRALGARTLRRRYAPASLGSRAVPSVTLSRRQRGDEMSERDGLATIEAAWRDLTAALEGEVVLPGSPPYDEVRRPQIPRFHDVRPRAVVLCRTPGDVVEAIAFARRSGIQVAVRSGGHDFAGRSSGPGMVLDLTPMQSLEVSDGLVTVGPGLRLGDLYAALAGHEVAIPGGCGATVGIGGQALGGGPGLRGP